MIKCNYQAAMFLAWSKDAIFGQVTRVLLSLILSFLPAGLFIILKKMCQRLMDISQFKALLTKIETLEMYMTSFIVFHTPETLPWLEI